MVGPLVALTALALGSHSPSAPAGEYALVQLTPAATCIETVPLLEAGATSVAPSLRVFRLPLATARRLAPGLRSARRPADPGARPPAGVAAVQSTRSRTRSSPTNGGAR